MIIKAALFYAMHFRTIKSHRAAAKRFISFCDSNPEYLHMHKDIYDYVKKNGLRMYPYEWFDLLRETEYKVVCEGNKSKYTIYNGRKMYYQSNFKNKEIIAGLNFYEKEQDARSPHCYIPSEDKGIKEGDVLLECGSSEGTFSLNAIDLCSKIYIFEGDRKYIYGLKKTFAPYGDKVVIIDKYVDSYSHGDYVAIDDVIDEPINFVKMDIEGFELKALYGASKTIGRSRQLRMSICAYHNSEDSAVISAYLNSIGCRCEVSNKFLFRTDEEFWKSKIPQLRPGMIYASKEVK